MSKMPALVKKTGAPGVRPGGDVALLGIPASPVTLNLSEAIIFKGVTVRGEAVKIILDWES